MAELLLPAAAVVPHGEEHDRHGPHRIAPKQNGIVLPMAESQLLVDVFVCQIDASGEAHLAVDNQQLPVIPVVEPGGHDRDKRFKHAAANAPDSSFLR